MDIDNQTRLDEFMSTPSDNKLITIYGPTASGKTRLALEIAQSISSEVVSVDARQIYRMLNIGTGKITAGEMQGIQHHMIDIIDINTRFSVVEFKNMAETIIHQLWSRGKIPVLCGGTGLYIDSLILHRSYPTNEGNWELREELESYRISHGNQALWEQLFQIDPEYAVTLHPNNYRYIIRGIEVKKTLGTSKMESNDQSILRYPTLFLTPYDGNREQLYTTINSRIGEMFNNGLIDEVGYIIDTIFGGDLQTASSSPGLNTIGYKEVLSYLKGEITRETCESLIAQHNRNYAKRQITWNKKYESLNTQWGTSNT